jgi:Lrp/AsnC family transcriptional regulator, regulator for asnA, asnC and gidA
VAAEPAVGRCRPRPVTRTDRIADGERGTVQAHQDTQANRQARRQGDAETVTGQRRSGRSGDEVSELDKRIIEHLQQDGRRPFTQIAADLGVSEAAVRARTNRLVDRGILQVVGVTDPLKLGFQQMAMIGIRCEAARLMDVAARCAEMPEVDYVVITAGTYDILIETVCEDNEGLLRFLAERLRTIDGVRETETFVYLRMVKQSYQWGTR